MDPSAIGLVLRKDTMMARTAVHAPLQPFGRKPRLDGFAQDVLAGVSAEFEARWHSQREIDKAVREERHARFQRMGHARAVEARARAPGGG